VAVEEKLQNKSWC